MARHILTQEERKRGFRQAVLSVQTRYNMEYNEAVQWLLRKSAKQAGYNGNWVEYRQVRLNGNSTLTEA